MKHYIPRKKKPVKLSEKMKMVRVDWRTQIEVSVSISDKDAINRYYQRHTTIQRPPEPEEHIIPKDECFEIPQTELAAVVDDSNLLEIE